MSTQQALPSRMRRTRRSVAAAAAVLLTAASPPQAAGQGPHDLVIRSTEKLELSAGGDDEWYEKGIWPLVGAALAIIVTNAVSVSVVYLQSRRAFDALIRQRRVEALGASLSQFYDPMAALLSTNAEIFARTGPSTFPEDGIRREAAASVWREARRRILANNAEIETILRTRSHLISEGDGFDAYKPLLLHVAMYDVFQDLKTEVYRNFLFPEDVGEHVAMARLRVLQAYHRSTGEQM